MRDDMLTRVTSVLRPVLELVLQLGRDRSGNVILIVAAAVFPLLALVGSGIDMGRGYLAESRLQQACDAGALAARKRLGTSAAVNGNIPDDVADTGQRFFNINFRDGAYGTQNREFTMYLEGDYSISGTASADVPTTIMQVFGFENISVSVECQTRLNMANTDVMMVLDVTGSMTLTNSGDDVSRIEALKSTVRSFHAQMTAATHSATRLRFGFVPYSTNVNVGGLLQDNWMVDEWEYQSRERIANGTQESTRTYERNWTKVAGSKDENNTVSTYDADWSPGGGPGGTYSCNQPLPADNLNETDALNSSADYPFVGPPNGTQTVEQHRRNQEGYTYSQTLSGSTCLVQRTDYNSYVEDYELVTEPFEEPLIFWRYKQLEWDVRDWRTDPASNGCIEERDTYEITDFDNVDLSRAKDLDIDLVPTSDVSTQWRPMYPYAVYARDLKWNGSGNFDWRQSLTTDEYVQPAAINRALCPPAARKLQTMDEDQLDSYLGTLTAAGNTYHDIGMIWGGRLLSPNGLFASENADVSSSSPTTRHLIFLTDGQTAPRDVSYATYGIEPIDRRRWSQSSPLTLTQTVENRFSFVCEEVKKRNIMVWVVSFGTSANSVMEGCAGTERYFVADDADELEQTFSDIAKRMGELRVAQ